MSTRTRTTKLLGLAGVVTFGLTACGDGGGESEASANWREPPPSRTAAAWSS